MVHPEIDRAVAILRRGGLVAFPTETVYGLGADAMNAAAVARIFEVKGRPHRHPLIVHIRGIDDLGRFARAAPETARRLAERFWPGPLTMILPRAPGVPDGVTGGHDTIGLRAPAHPLARALLARFGGGIAAPSANRFGRLSPTRAEHVREELGDAVDLVLDGGPCDLGLESTIVDLAGPEPAVLRPGAISPRELEAALGRPVRVAAKAERPAPGTLESHYAPRTPLFVVPPARLDAEAAREVAAGRRTAVLAPRLPPPAALAAAGIAGIAGGGGPDLLVWRLAPAHPRAFARDLYAALRELDRAGAASILVEEPPPGEEWLAVRDRLTRAAAGV